MQNKKYIFSSNNLYWCWCLSNELTLQCTLLYLTDDVSAHIWFGFCFMLFYVFTTYFFVCLPHSLFQRYGIAFTLFRFSFLLKFNSPKWNKNLPLDHKVGNKICVLCVLYYTEKSVRQLFYIEKFMLNGFDCVGVSVYTYINALVRDILMDKILNDKL